jgi:alpha-ketoglutarate-dependent taurine dioxygenase
MNKAIWDRTARTKPSITGRKALTSSRTPWVKIDYLQDGEAGPMVILSAVRGVDLMYWVANNREFLEKSLVKQGAVLFRGFDVVEVEQFEQFTEVISAELLEYRERSSPRHPVRGNIYTSTDYPANLSIFFHCENSYQRVWPMKLFFFCVEPAEQGGETPIADTRKIFKRLSPNVVSRFTEKRCMYVRNFDNMFGLSWRSVFQTDERSVVEEYCRLSDIEFEWKGNDRLKTCSVRSAVNVHPTSKEEVWFNHVAFFHVSTLTPAIREGLLASMEEQDLPANTYYGDGTPIEPFVLEELREAYLQEAVSFSWEKGDILLLDNMLMAHSRRPYVGQRKVVVAMSEPFTSQ